MHRRLGLTAFILSILLWPATADALPLDTLKPGVVKLYVTKDGGLDDTGAGIVIGLEKGALFILTAHHVIEDATSIKVTFDSERWTAYEAELYRYDESMDVATVLVRLSDPGALPETLPKYQTRTEDPVYDERVTAIGHPSDNLEWHPSAERVAQAVSEDPNTFLITRSQSDRGFSGGPVFDDDGALLGVVLSVSGQQTKAVLLQAVLRKLEFWKAPHKHLVTGEAKPGDGGPGDSDPTGGESSETTDDETTAIEVPDVMNQSQARSIETLILAGLKAGKVTYRETGRAEPDVVIAQNPRAGTTVEPGTTVDLAVSRAPTQVTQVEVPKLTKMTQARAKSLLERAGLRVGTVTKESTTGASDMVLRQSVRPGTMVRPRTVVDLVVSAPARTVLTTPVLTLLRPLSFKEDCLKLNPDKITVENVRGRWKIVESGNRWLFDFEGSETEARMAYKIIRHYRMTNTCFIGRPDASLTYMKVSGKAPAGSLRGEDCISFTPANLAVKQLSGRWKITSGRSLLFDFGSSKTEAEQSLEVLKYYGFTQSCYVGRPGPSFKYLRK